MITIIVAIGHNYVIGKDGWMPWNIPEDLRHFKEKTLNHTVVMGRKTFDAIGRPLPRRKNIVVTRDPRWHFDGVEVIDDFELFLQKNQKSENEIFIAGGAQIYETALPYAEKMIISHIDTEIDGDTFFPKWDRTKFDLTDTVEYTDFSVKTYQKKKGIL
ncbi:MAG: dihydrofolate reductase [Erysipelotrichaceae bacterium]|nr:dihydrofolate reductase [Erysipelotrichaceae bacterium]MDP3306322.1 dihydrofolate reductase [Erysipelotrichaceae bacterium]